MQNKSSPYLGALIPIGLTAISFLVTHWIGLNVILISLILGILFGNIIPLPKKYDPGISKSSGFVLELAIVFMAFSINYKSLLDLGWELILILIATVIFVLFTTIHLAKRLKCPGSTGWLVGFGTAICGSSAIAALAPIVTKNKEDVGLSLAVVNVLGLVGMIALPYLGQAWLTDSDLAILLGTSLHSAGNVAGAGFVVNENVGELAVTIKMGRIALLTPALFAFQWILGNQGSSSRKSFKLPWYLLAFVIISLIVSFLPIPQAILDLSKNAATILLAIAMTAIGLKMNLRQVVRAGRKGLIFGTVIFILQIGFITGLIFVL